MYKYIISLILMTHMSWLYAISQEQKNSEPNQSSLALVNSLEMYQKQSSGNFITVGGDPNVCHFSSIQDAIDTIPFSGSGEIHIVTNKTYNENLVIDDIHVSLIGGYQDCVTAGSPFISPSDDQVVINGGNTASVLKIIGESQRSTIVLRNLRFIDGLGLAPNSDSAGGGILAYQSNAFVSLDNVDVRSNDAEFGGGIAIINGDTDMLFQNSRVLNNLASYGGGIYCEGGNSSVVMRDQSGIIANVANGDQTAGIEIKPGRAGGIYVSSCYFGLHSGSANGGLVGIASNIAFGSGGGIYADGGATVLLNGQQICNANTCIGDYENPVNVTGNVAGFTQEFARGGGLYVKDSSTNVTIHAGLIESNSAPSIGGGISIRDASLTVDRLEGACWNKDHCNYFANNNLTSQSTSGGAISNNKGDIDISASVFENNVAVKGAAIYTTTFTDPTVTRVESSVFFQNGDADKSQSIIYSRGGTADVTFIHTTIADNNLLDNTFGVAVFRSEFGAGGAYLSLHSSIVDNADFDVLSHDMINYEVDISCIIANEAESMSASNNLINFSAGNAGGAFITQDNPAFIDQANFDYHLAENSPAIDYCHTPTHATVLYKDIDFEERGYDDPNVSDNSLFTFYDIGVDESYLSDVIFSDGFE